MPWIVMTSIVVTFNILGLLLNLGSISKELIKRQEIVLIF